jgi:UDP-3-O-[3-hydroxymyristoyl] N-acetylglucosamine deacetylase
VLVRTDHGVAVRLGPGGPTIDLVEHLCAALGALGVRDGLTVRIEGSEVPLLDGGARAHCAALRRLGVAAAPPPVRVARAEELVRGDSRYRFEPAEAPHVAVAAEFPAPLGRQTASWDGSGADFEQHIADARTFGFAREAEALRSVGRAAHVDLTSMMVFDEAGRVLPPGAPMAEGEIARHKLLDLVGDLYLHGGPPRGRVTAHRPGHGATHAVVAEAFDRGILVRTG